MTSEPSQHDVVAERRVLLRQLLKVRAPWPGKQVGDPWIPGLPPAWPSAHNL